MATAGPNFPTAATGNTGTIGFGTKSWGTPTNIFAADAIVTTSSMLTGEVTDDLIGTGFGFSIPAGATINGITLEVNAKASVNIDVSDNSVRLIKAGAAAGLEKGVNTLTTTLTTFTYGGPADLWGTTWTPADINASNFGAAVSYINNNVSLSRTASVDFMRITITFTPPATATNRFFMMF